MPTVTRLVMPSAPLALLVLMVRAVLSAAVPLHSVKGGNGQLNPPLLDPPITEDPAPEVAPPELELVTPPLPLAAAELAPPVELPALEPPPPVEDDAPEEELEDVLSVPVLVLHPPPSKPPTANKPPTAAVQEKMRMAATFR